MFKKILLVILIIPLIHFNLISNNSKLVKDSAKNSTKHSIKDYSLEEYFSKNKYQFYFTNNQLTFKKDHIKIKLILYLPLFQINHENYFFNYYPHQTTKGITLHQKDYQLLTNIINYYQKRTTEKKEQNLTAISPTSITKKKSLTSKKQPLKSPNTTSFPKLSNQLKSKIFNSEFSQKTLKKNSNLESYQEKIKENLIENTIYFDFNNNINFNKIFLDAGHGGKDPRLCCLWL